MAFVKRTTKITMTYTRTLQVARRFRGTCLGRDWLILFAYSKVVRKASFQNIPGFPGQGYEFRVKSHRGTGHRIPGSGISSHVP